MASAFSSELTCPICLELFDDPVTLPCMHSYCRECLESILETGGGRHVQCPACRKIESLNKAGLQKPPRNFTLANIVATYRSVDKNPQIPCDLCDEKLQQNAAKSCPECNLSYCINCLIVHHPQRGVLAKHSLIEPQEFVSKKKKLVCLKCAVLPGKDSKLEACKRDHGSDVMDVETAKIKLTSQMQGDYVKLDERRRKYLQDIYKTTETLNNIMKNADTERKELKQKCHEKMEEIISNFKTDFERDLKRISDDYDSGVKEVEDKGQRHLRQLKEASDHLQYILPDMKKMLQENGKDLDFKDLAAYNYAGPRTAAVTVSCFFPDNRDSVRILDIGAGTGLVADELQKYDFTNIDALEPNEEMLVVAREKNIYKQYYNVYVPEDGETTVPSNTYDVITCSGSFGNGHLPCNVLSEFIRITKPDGLVVICTDPLHFTNVTQYRDRLTVMMTSYEKDGKWQKLKEDKIPKYIEDRDGVLLVFRVTS